MRLDLALLWIEGMLIILLTLLLPRGLVLEAQVSALESLHEMYTALVVLADQILDVWFYLYSIHLHLSSRELLGAFQVSL
jgi:fumarate reductase subunit D